MKRFGMALVVAGSLALSGCADLTNTQQRAVTGTGSRITSGRAPAHCTNSAIAVFRLGRRSALGGQNMRARLRAASYSLATP